MFDLQVFDLQAYVAIKLLHLLLFLLQMKTVLLHLLHRLNPFLNYQTLQMNHHHLLQNLEDV